MLRQPEEAFELPAIKANHCLPINEGDGGRPKAHLQELLEGDLIRPDVLVHEGYPFSRKKLFLLVAGPSPGLRIHDHLLGHCLLRVPPDCECLPVPSPPGTLGCVPGGGRRESMHQG